MKSRTKCLRKRDERPLCVKAVYTLGKQCKDWLLFIVDAPAMTCEYGTSTSTVVGCTAVLGL